MPVKRVVAAKKQPKPKGTRCYVPGYCDEASQFIIDQSQLGIAPLAIAAKAVSIIPGISFKTPSEKRARKVIPGVVASANNGNLVAVAVMDNRRRIGGAGIAKERAEWQKGFDSVVQSVRAVYDPIANRVLASIPSGYKGPEEAAQYATQVVKGPSDFAAPQAGQPTQQPVVQQPVVQQPASGGGGFTLPPINISVPAPAPSGTLPVPATSLPGGESQVPEEVAKGAADQQGTQPGLASMFGGGDQMTKLILAGTGLYILAQVMGKRR